MVVATDTLVNLSVHNRRVPLFLFAAKIERDRRPYLLSYNIIENFGVPYYCSITLITANIYIEGA